MLVYVVTFGTGCDWYRARAARDLALLRLNNRDPGGFTLTVPDGATPDEITDRVERAAMERTYDPLTAF